ncbi:MAG: nickel permease, partial [Pannonibacter phragmitetus]
AVAYKVRQDTLLVYEPLIVVTLFYVGLTIILTRIFKYVEAQVPVRR